VLYPCFTQGVEGLRPRHDAAGYQDHQLLPLLFGTEARRPIVSGGR
jgi:hypothetical protein